MTADGFNSAFQEQMAGPLPSTHDIAKQVIARDQRRVVILATLSVIFWLLGAAGMLLLVIDLNEFVMLIRKCCVRQCTRYCQSAGEERDRVSPSQVEVNVGRRR